MKQHIHHHGKKYFTIFLVMYCILLMFHISEIPFDGFISYGTLALGIFLAVVSHRRHGFETLALLMVHMSIEWWQHAQHFLEYSTQEMVLSAIHVLFDGVFLWEELTVHTKNKQKYIILSVILVVMLVMLLVSKYIVFTPVTTQSNSLFEILVMGGIMGCIISHVFLQKRN